MANQYPTASEMRELTQKKIDSDVSVYLDHLFSLMKDSSTNSLNLTWVWKDLDAPSPTTDQWSAVKLTLVALGYEVRHHDDPDPGHPCSCGDYYTLHW